MRLHSTNPRTVGYARYARNNQVNAEKELWRHIRRQALGVKFRRQFPVGDYCLDFFCFEAMLAVEVDGTVHEIRRETDQERDDYLALRGIQVLRVSNGAVFENLAFTLDLISNVAAQRLSR